MRACALGATIAVALLAASAGASAQSYPERPVRVLIAFPAGGTIDTLGRIIAQKLTEAWGQNVIIENRPGGGGNIGAAAAAKSAPDGYTLHLGAQTLELHWVGGPRRIARTDAAARHQNLTNGRAKRQ